MTGRDRLQPVASIAHRRLARTPALPPVCSSACTPASASLIQTAEGFQWPTNDLAPFGLTKAEKPQVVVNLSPVEPIKLYGIVEVLEDN
ncbi:hypothetical protein BC827DRAFT_1264319 [Russula dissimulans]|nr:hypothetical protein BC827DRAFT_1264319 [Russula dissimulans]